MIPPIAVPIVHDRYSPPRSSEFAAGRSSGSTRLGSPAYEAGRKKPVANPAAAANTTICPALVVKGSTAKMPS